MRRLGWAVTTHLTALGIGLSALFHPIPRLIWNGSASVPVGLYFVHSASALHVNELLVVRPPEPLATFLDVRRYLPNGVPLLKHVLALPRQTVCRIGDSIRIDGVLVGQALARDRRGRPLPAWQGCRALRDGEVFLMNRRPADSLDGRYFGPLPAAAIPGRADPLWTSDRR